MTSPAPTIHNDGLPEEAAAALGEVFSAHLADSVGGMAFAVYRQGAPLFRAYGGATVLHGQQPGEGLREAQSWTQDTMTTLFSGTKGVVATIAAVLTDSGDLDPRERVAEIWPEFGAAGKAETRIHHLLGHSAGLLYLDPRPDFDPSQDPRRAAAVLAAQQPLWKPGTKAAYHALTYGILVGEVLRRVTGLEVGELVRTRLAEPHGLDIHLGLPESLDHRVATVGRAEGYRISTYLHDPERRRIIDRMYGSVLTGEEPPLGTVQARRAGDASGGGIGSADSMAALYSLLADPRAPLVSAQALAQATGTWTEAVDEINDRPLRFGLGYELADPLGTFGPVAPAFGHTGAGGGLHGAWPHKNVGLSFLTNEMRSEDMDRRAKDLLAVLARHIRG